MDRLHPISFVVARRCPVDARRAATALDSLIAAPRLLPLDRTSSSLEVVGAVAHPPMSPTWVGVASGRRRLGRRRHRMHVEVVPWSSSACEIQIRDARRRPGPPDPQWYAVAAALADDVAHLVPASLEALERAAAAAASLRGSRRVR